MHDEEAAGGAGPFHAGELEVQRRARVSGEAARVGRMIQPVLLPLMRTMLAEARVAMATTLEAEGRVWVSLLSGPPGFLCPVDEELVSIQHTPAGPDPLHGNLAVRPELGLLVIDFARRRRLRVNGRGLLQDGRLFLVVQQAYANCPKYIHPRRVQPVKSSAAGAAVAHWSDPLTPRQQDWIARADCFVVGSYHPGSGADASHRGGAPGFVQVLGDRLLMFPDYPGNNMFNTLGNLAVFPRAGLLFFDFEKGGLLQLTGRSSLNWPKDGAGQAPEGPRASVRFLVERVLERQGVGLVGE